MTNLTVLPTPNYRQQRQKDTIRILQDMLERARQGDITEVAMAWVTSTGQTGNRSSSTADCARLLGAVAMMQHHMATLIHDDGEDLTPPEAS